MFERNWPPYRSRVAWALVFLAGALSLLMMVKLFWLVWSTRWTMLDLSLTLLGVGAASLLLAWPLCRSAQ